MATAGGWLTTVAGRMCLDMLRSRTTRREDPLHDQAFTVRDGKIIALDILTDPARLARLDLSVIDA
ncbi:MULTISPECIES: hypothetical protein [unclassified Streptomyces]|uniref:hypothetical protein n=1 Tax=unclassified Streptomyces TaxID=2593676 RepID=UPI002258190F|nr:hypothetical protein [Streptomyces sp. NBC_00047]MCX5609816.1 hypothetical protein [Streptomyces sp. NBC_00047]